MKKVLVITHRSENTATWLELERFIAEFCQKVSAKLDDIKLIYTTYGDMVYTLESGKTKIFDTRNKLDISKVQLVHFKNWLHNTAEAPVIAAHLKAKDIPFFNSEVNLPISPGKLAQMFLLASNQIPVPDTFYAPQKKLKELFEENDIPAGFNFPLILKANDGARGDDNYLIKDAKEAINILESAEADKQFIVQNFVPNDGDYRYLFAGLDRNPLVIHRRANDDNHLNNTSKGAEAEFLDLDSLPKEYLQYARKAAELLGREISGVDILVDKESKKAYILEVNRTPALATGFGMDEKVDHFTDFIESQLGNLEEDAEE